MKKITLFPKSEILEIRKKAMSSLGRFGGLETLEKHGKEHFSRIAKLSWEKRKRKGDKLFNGLNKR